MIKINIYSKCNTPEENVRIEIGEVFKLITSDKFKKDAEYLRQEKDDNKRRAYKQNNLPAITFGGTFTKSIWS